PVSTVQVYTPSTNKWTTVSTLPVARALLGAASGANGQVYAVGGTTAAAVTPTAEVDVFTPSTSGGSGGGGGGIGTVVLGGVNQIYVEALFKDLLNRAADPSGLDVFTTQLNTGSDTRLQVVNQIMASAEFLTDEINALY